MVKVVKEMLRHYVNLKQDDWHNHLAVLKFGYNNTVSAITGETTFEINLGYHPRYPGSHSTTVYAKSEHN